MLLDSRGKSLVFASRSMKRRKRRRNFIIAFLFCAGIGVLIYAFSSRHREESDPSVASRTIVSHASALPDDSFAPDSQDLPADAQSPDQKSAPNSAAKSKKQTAPPKDSMDILPGTGANAKSASAMLDLVRQPVQLPGAVVPKIGHFHMVAAKVAYRDDVAPELIAAAEATTHVVIAGDILGRIAQKYGCTIAQVQKANRMTSDQIKIGQKLLIPNCVSQKTEDIVPLVEETAVPAVPRGKWWKRVGVNTSALPKLLADEGFKPPQKFMAFIIEFTFDETRQVIIRERAFDYKGTSTLNSGWNPASAIKIFAAIGALRRIDSLGFTSRARITFQGRHPYSTTVRELIEAAIIQSDNIAYNRVVQLASFDSLHNDLLTARFGITQTALNRGYELTRWKELGGDPSLRVSPEISIVEGGKKMTLAAAVGKAPAVCSSAACTSLQDLAESSRRLMLQEQLPEDESFNLKNEDLLMLRRAMRSADRTRGTEMVDRFAAVFKDPRVKFYSKPGFSSDWFTDNAYIFDPTQNQAWIVVMSGYPGRHSLDSAATAIARIIHSGKLKNIP